MQNRHLALIAVAILLLSACGGGGGGGGGGPTDMRPAPMPEPEPTPPPLTSSNPEYHLGTARFTTHQPDVLEQIGAHHAYARGLTGRGVKIGIDDTIVDYTQSAEFGGRVKAARCGRGKPFVPAPVWRSTLQRCRRVPPDPHVSALDGG